MKTYKASQTPGFFDVELRVRWLLDKGNPLSRLDAVINWESFRPLLEAALDQPTKGPGGPRPNDPLKMFKALLVQRFYNLSDEQVEYQINDRLSFQQFIGWTLADKVPDANTLWDFREALVQAGAFEKLFALFDQQLRTRGLLAQPGKLVDASFVDVPRQRNTREDNATIKGGGAPAAWAEQPAKQRQKDLDARWTRKNDEVHYGYKNHVKAEAQSKLIEKYAVTDASVQGIGILILAASRCGAGLRSAHRPAGVARPGGEQAVSRHGVKIHARRVPMAALLPVPCSRRHSRRPLGRRNHKMSTVRNANRKSPIALNSQRSSLS